MNYYEPMVFYTNKLDKTFFPVVYVREDGVLERQLELLRQAGWKIIELSCEKFLKSSGSEVIRRLTEEEIGQGLGGGVKAATAPGPPS